MSRTTKGKAMFTVSFEVLESIKVAVGDTGLETVVDIKAIAAHPDLLRFALLAGFIGSLNNISRGKHEDTDKPNSDVVWAGMRDKRVKAWLAGEWSQRAGGERATTALKEAYIDDLRASSGATLAQVERGIKDLVSEMFGKDEPATFSRFMDALALTMARRDHGDDDGAVQEATVAYRERIEAKYAGLAEAAKTKRAGAAAKLDVTGITL